MSPWNKPIKSYGNQSVQPYTETGLEISIDFGPENMWHIANLDKQCLSHSNHVVRQVTSFSNLTFFVARQRCFVARHVFGNQLINYLLTGYQVCTEKYYAFGHVAQTSLRSVRTM